MGNARMLAAIGFASIPNVSPQKMHAKIRRNGAMAVASIPLPIRIIAAFAAQNAAISRHAATDNAFQIVQVNGRYAVRNAMISKPTPIIAAYAAMHVSGICFVRAANAFAPLGRVIATAMPPMDAKSKHCNAEMPPNAKAKLKHAVPNVVRQRVATRILAPISQAIASIAELAARRARRRNPVKPQNASTSKSFAIAKILRPVSAYAPILKTTSTIAALAQRRAHTMNIASRANAKKPF